MLGSTRQCQGVPGPGPESVRGPGGGRRAALTLLYSLRILNSLNSLNSLTKMVYENMIIFPVLHKEVILAMVHSFPPQVKGYICGSLSLTQIVAMLWAACLSHGRVSGEA